MELPLKYIVSGIMGIAFILLFIEVLRNFSLLGTLICGLLLLSIVFSVLSKFAFAK